MGIINNFIARRWLNINGNDINAYIKANKNIKNNQIVIEHFISNDINNLKYMPINYQENLLNNEPYRYLVYADESVQKSKIKSDYSLIQYASLSPVKDILLENPDAIMFYLSEKVVSEIYNSDLGFIKEFFNRDDISKDTKSSLLKKESSIIGVLSLDQQLEYFNSSYDYNVKKKYFSLVDINVKKDILNIVIDMIERGQHSYDNLQDFFVKIKDFSNEEQLELVTSDNRLLCHAVPEVQQQYIGDSYDLVRFASPEVQVQYLKNNPHLINALEYARDSIDVCKNQPELFSSLSTGLLTRGLLVCNEERLIEILSLFDKVDKRFMLNLFNSIKESSFINIALNNLPNNKIIEIMNIDNNLMYYFWHAMANDEKFSNLMKDYYGNELYIKLEPFLKKMNDSKENYLKDSFSAYREKDNILKMKLLLNKKILASNNIDNLMVDNLYSIIRNAYGEKSAQLLKLRPGLNLENISNLDFLDEKIINNFGESFVNDLLSYKIAGSDNLLLMLKDEQLLSRFKRYYNDMTNIYGANVETMQKCFFNYNQFDELYKNISNLSGQEITNNIKNNLNLLLTSKYNILNIKDLNGLENYPYLREKYYTDLISKHTNIREIKNDFTNYFFGLPYDGKFDNNNYNDPITKQFLSFMGQTENYRINYFIKHYSNFLNENEINMLYFMNILKKIEEPSILRNVFRDLTKENDIINPIALTTAKEKIHSVYVSVLNNQLLTPEKIEIMYQDGLKKNSEQILKKVIDNVPIYDLQGCPFKILVHYFGLHNSLKDTPSYDEIKGDPIKNWYEYEEMSGLSTISTSLMSSDLPLGGSGYPDAIDLGFCQPADDVVAFMGYRDMMTCHEAKHVYGSPEHHYGFMSPDSLIKYTAQYYENNRPYNEVALYRRHREHEKIGDAPYGGKIKPDYVICYNENYEKNGAVKMAKKLNVPILFIHRDKYEYSLENVRNREINDPINNASPTIPILGELNDYIEGSQRSH